MPARRPTDGPGRRRAVAAAMALGLLLALGGTASSALYVWSAAGALGRADRSVVFWYSGFLVFGIALSAAGVALLLVLMADEAPGEPILPAPAVRAATWLLAGAGGLAAVAGVALAVWHLAV